MPAIAHEGVIKRLIMYATFALSALMALPLCRGIKVTWAMSPNYLCMIPATAQKLVTKSKVVHDVVDIWPDALKATSYRFPTLLLRIVSMISHVSYNFSDIVTTISLSLRGTLRKIVPKSVDVKVVDNCVASEFFLVPPRTRRETFRVMYLGTLGPSNDFETLIEAASKLGHDSLVSFTIAGAGESLLSIRTSIVEKHIENIQLYGEPIRHEEVPEWLEQADALILPLRSGFGDTSFPSKLGEYLASGRPVIITADGMLANEIKSKGVALVIAPSDVYGLVESISMLRRDNELYDKLCSTGREYAKDHLCFESLDENVESVIQLAWKRKAPRNKSNEGDETERRF